MWCRGCPPGMSRIGTAFALHHTSALLILRPKTPKGQLPIRTIYAFLPCPWLLSGLKLLLFHDIRRQENEGRRERGIRSPGDRPQELSSPSVTKDGPFVISEAWPPEIPSQKSLQRRPRPPCSLRLPGLLLSPAALRAPARALPGLSRLARPPAQRKYRQGPVQISLKCLSF